MNKMKELNCILLACDQKCPIEMKEIFANVTGISKIGEGVFGEVYKGDIVSASRTQDKGQGDQNEPSSIFKKMVFKVVPIQGKDLINGEHQKTFMEVLPEIFISKDLSKLSNDAGQNFTKGFIECRGTYLGTGEYPQDLITAWKKWDDVYKSDNEIPDYEIAQKYMVLVYEHGGHDLNAYEFRDVKQAFFMLIQTIYVFAVAETALEFEHRDLHGNNILLRRTTEEFQEFKIDGKLFRVPTYGIYPKIIDFTFSRTKDPETNVEICLGMGNDEEMFMSLGNYQFDIYRMMRDSNRNEWNSFNPKTNLMWIHHLTDKLLEDKDWSTEVSKNKKDYKYYIRQLKNLKAHLLMYSSCRDLALSPVFSACSMSDTE